MNIIIITCMSCKYKRGRTITKKKVLIVEDGVTGAMFLGKLVELWGYEICEIITSGIEAIKEAERQKPDIVLIDIHLKGEINGIVAAEWIHSRLGIPIIFMTGYLDEETKEKALIANPVGYLSKPLDYKKLNALIDSVVGNKNH
jgi:CheY-like chemotaxis protein